ncbi:MAG: PEGA domain-containing protein [Myxococcaceae bacterium]|nr:PEGA domain-containing protein [Myxococcaceae bacterium]
MTLPLIVLLSLTAAAPAKGKGAKDPAPAAKKEEPASNDPAAKAKQIFGRAQTLYSQARYQEAIASFEEAYLLKPHPVIFFNIGKCWEQLGETAKALRAYRDYLRLLPDAADKDTVNDAIANLERRLKERGVQQLMVFADPPDAKIEVDGKGLGTSPASVELSAGNHKLAVTRDGYESVERSFVMQTTRSTEMTITLRPVSAAKTEPVASNNTTSAPKEAVSTAPSASTSATAQPKKGGRVFTWVAAGLALVGVGSGVTFGVLTMGKSNEIQTLDPMRTRMQADALQSTASTYALVTNISWVVAGVAAAAAVVLFILEGRG